LAAVASGCVVGLAQGVPGNGVIQKATREVGDFHEVEVHGAFQATIALGERRPVVIEGDENLLELITTEVRGERLVVGVNNKTGINPTKPITLTVTTPALDAVILGGASKADVTAGESDKFTVHASGATKATVKGLKTKTVDVEASGASQVTLEGSGETVKLGVSGASKANLTAFPVGSVQAEVSGASSAVVNVSQAVKGGVSGASELKVEGTPTARNVSTSGASRVVYPPAQVSK
jgi:hypothetical protein